MATFPLLLERTGTEKFGLTRIPQEELAFPEEYKARGQRETNDEEIDLILDGVEEGNDEGGSTEFVSESTPLLK